MAPGDKLTVTWSNALPGSAAVLTVFFTTAFGQAAPGGQLAFANVNLGTGAVVNINGTVTTSGVVTSSPSTSVPATNAKTATITTPTTTNLVAATVGVQVLLISVTVQLYITTIGAGTITFSLQDTSGTHILDLQAQDTATAPRTR